MISFSAGLLCTAAYGVEKGAMIFRKKNHLVGLDIGSSLVKVAEFKDTKKGHVLKNFGIAQLPMDAITEGHIRDVEGVAGVIRNLFKTHGIKEKNVALSTGGYSVVIKTINVPAASEGALQDSIRFEAEQYIPYDIEDVNIDYQVLGASEFSPDQMSILLVAVKKDLVAEYIDLAGQAGLNPCIIDVDTFALQNIYEATMGGREERVTLLVDVGASKTSLNILKGGSSLMMRDNSSGTVQLREEIMQEAGCGPEEADRILSGEVEGIMSVEQLEEICRQVVSNWCSEIHSVVNSFQSKSSDGEVEQVIISGGGTFIKGFAQGLTSELEAEVSIFNPFEGMLIDEKRFPADVLNKMAPLAPIALGLALRRVDDK